jgi:hypothetical protein
MKNIVVFKSVFLIFLSLFLANSTNAQLTNCNVFLQGNYVEVGINTNGAFGSSTAAPAGYHPRGGVNMQNTCSGTCSGTSTLGFVADPAKDGWTVGSPAYFGDFFMPGAPQEGWSLEVNGVQSNAWNGNNAICDSTGQFSGSLTGGNVSYSNNGRTRAGTWQGSNGDTIGITQVTSMDTSNLFFTMNVTLKNNGTVTKNNIYYQRTVDPDNDQTNTGLFKTVNSVAYQLPNINNRTLVTATGSIYTQAYLGLGTLDCRAKCYIMNSLVKPTVNCDVLYSGSSLVSYSGGFTKDVGIGLVFNLGNLAPGDSVTFSYAYVLNAAYLDIAFPTTLPRYSVSGDTAASHASKDTAYVCQNTPATVNIVNGGNYNWSWASLTGDTLSLTSGPTTRFNAHTTVSILKAIGMPICTGLPDTLIMIIDPSKALPADPAAGSNGPLCAGATLNLTAASSTGVSYSWAGPSSFLSLLQNPSVTGVTTGATGTYSVVASLNGCKSHTGTTSVVVSAMPSVAPISGTTAICAGSAIAFTDATAGGVWSVNNTAVATVDASGNITGVATGTTTVTYSVTNIGGCTAFVTKAINVNPVPTVSTIIGIDSTCVGLTDTLFNVTTGGLWSSANTSIVAIDSALGVYRGVGPGTTTVFYTLTNGFGCAGIASVVTTIHPLFTITPVPPVNGTIIPSGPVTTCFNDTTTFTISPNAGYAIADVIIDGISFGPMGSYMFTGVLAPHTISVNFTATCTPPSISCTGNITQNADPGLCNAVVTYAAATATGTSPTITYSQNSGTSFPVGNTVVIATATNTCGTDNCSFNITVSDNQAPVIIAPADITVSADTGVCLTSSVALGVPLTSDNCGIATVTNNGVPPYVVGTTTVIWTVTDIHGNTATAIQNVTVVDNQNPAITASADVTVNTDPGACSAATAALGTPITADNCGVASVSNNAMPPYPVGTTVVTWTVIDVNGNSSIATQNVMVVDNQSPTITVPAGVTVNADLGLCSAATVALGTPVTGDNCGVASVTNDGTPPYPVGTTIITWTVTDVHGNSTRATQNVTVVDNQAPSITPPVNITVNADPGACSAATVVLGTPVTADNCGVASVTNNALPPFAVGTTVVTWTVTDIHGNTKTATQNVTVIDNQNPTITAPGAITVNANTGACYATSVSLGTPVTADNCGVAGVTNTAPTFFPVGTTVVTWTVTDIHGNTATATQSVTVIDNQRPVITAPADVTKTGYCSPVTVTLGTPVTSDNCGVATVTNDAPAFFPVGTTVVTWTVTDIHGNTAAATQNVTVSGSITLTATTTNVLCFGGSTGGITTTVSGGTLPYGYIWNTGATTSGLSGIPAGTYTVGVTDAHDCRAGGIYTIKQPTALSLAGAVVVNVSCYGANDGSITTNVTGGTAPYSYSWGMGSSGANLTGLAPGTYSLVVTDANGCTISKTFTVTGPLAPLALTGIVTNAHCHGATGSVTTSITGGTASYAYLWSNAATTSNITAVAGTYSLTVTDAHGCKVKGAYTITQPASGMSFSPEIDNVSCHGGSDGHIDADVTGGTWPYTYSWLPVGVGFSLFDDLYFVPAGTYTITVTDGSGCSLTASYTVTEPAPISITATTVNVSCHGGSNGSINSTVAGGTAPYTYRWSNGSTLADPIRLAAGTYSVVVTDANGCTATASYTITQPSILTGGIAVNPVYNVIGGAAYTVYLGYGIQTDTLRATASGGTPGYTYSWAPIFGSTNTLRATPASTKTYSVTITDALGCTNVQSQTISVLDFRCSGDGDDDDDEVRRGCIYMCHSGRTVSVDSADVARYLGMGYILGPCRGSHKSAGSETTTGSEETIVPLAEIKVYPNPTNGVFNIEIPVENKEAQIMVSDITGRILETRTITDNDGQPVQFSLVNMPTGLYFVKINAGNKTQNDKIIKR